MRYLIATMGAAALLVGLAPMANADPGSDPSPGPTPTAMADPEDTPQCVDPDEPCVSKDPVDHLNHGMDQTSDAIDNAVTWGIAGDILG